MLVFFYSVSSKLLLNADTGKKKMTEAEWSKF